MDYSNPLLIKLRRIGQQLHILRPMLTFWRKLTGAAYEEAFDKYIVSAITPSSIVWDIGANIGFFTEKFLIATGDTGKVIAFDPSPGCIETLSKKFSGNSAVIIEPVGLSDASGVASFSASDSTDPTGGIGVRPQHDNVVEVNITTGDEYVESHKSRMPNYIKIDVEGYEFDVIKGMSTLLSNHNLRGVFIEVHFLELAKRNLADAPTEIVNIMKKNGFSVRWIDPSHLAAERIQ